jgi:MoaA/NifB/PqqE/SkfB family radical SAM enzyme
VVFTGGEPLMHSDLFRLSRMLRARGIRITILSSGLLLARHAASILADTDDVIVSLDGPPAIHDQIRGIPRAFDMLAEGVRALAGHPVAARCTVQALNCGHLRETVETARGLGLRSISFLSADLTSAAFNRPLSWSEAKREAVAPSLGGIEDLIAHYPDDGFILESPEKLRRMAAGLGPLRCNAPWVSAVVESNGDVRPCFFHPPIGNTSEGTLNEVLNSRRAVAFRESLNVDENPTCRRCVCSLYVSEAAGADPEALGPLAAGGYGLQA